MIARIWRGATSAADADHYLDYLHQTGIPDYQATPGNRGVYVLRRIEGDVTYFLLISLWESMDVIRGFAGHDLEKAKYYSEDERVLLELEPTVTHYEVFHQPGE
jgi:heme-degrading monooxygenase HmoA